MYQREGFVKFKPFGALVFYFISLYALSDVQIDYPETILTYDENRKFCALTTQTESTIFEKSCRFGKILYEVEGWHPKVFLLQQGTLFVSIYPGLNLVPLEQPLETIIIETWHDGVKSHEIKLSDLVTSIDALERTSSNYNWGHMKGLSGELLNFQTNEGSVSVNLQSGKVQFN